MSFPSPLKLYDSDGRWASNIQSSGALIAIALTVVFLFLRVLGKIQPTWLFFTRRWSFLESTFKKTGRDIFTFNVLQHSVTAVNGVTARKAFYDGKALDFREGYMILSGRVPQLQDIDIHLEDERYALLIKRIHSVLHRNRLSEALPSLLDDIQHRMDMWGKQGTIDPFKEINTIVFQMTVRMAACRELASDISTLEKLQEHYMILDQSATSTSLLFPWLPSSVKHVKQNSTKILFSVIQHHIEQRKKAPVPSPDTIDMLLGQGASDVEIIQFLFSVVFAAVSNTGIISSWLLLYISFHNKWKSAIHTELTSFLARNTNSSQPLHKRLSDIPYDVWEDELPTIELAMRETIRLAINSTSLRRNLPDDGQAFQIPGLGEVPPGGFVAYNVSDVHLNPNIYTEPRVFDPERFRPGREEDKREPYAFLGWGVGRHPCTGMKAAKLEAKMIVAMIVLGYEYNVVNSKGEMAERLPLHDYNDRQKRPKGDPCFIKFKRIVE